MMPLPVGAALAQPCCVADLVSRDRDQVVGGADLVGLGGVEVDVAGDREVVHRRRIRRPGQGRRVAEVVAADPDIAADPGSALLVRLAAGGLAVVRDDDEVDVGLRRPAPWAAWRITRSPPLATPPGWDCC